MSITNPELVDLKFSDHRIVADLHNGAGFIVEPEPADDEDVAVPVFTWEEAWNSLAEPATRHDPRAEAYDWVANNGFDIVKDDEDEVGAPLVAGHTADGRVAYMLVQPRPDTTEQAMIDFEEAWTPLADHAGVTFSE